MSGLLRALCCVLLASFFAGSAPAQNRANFPWWNSPIVSDLKLSPQQTQRIRIVIRSYRGRLLDARNNEHKAQADLEDLFNDENVSPEQSKAVVERVANARAVATRVFLEMSTNLRSVLTLEQWRQLVRRWDEVQKRRNSDTQTPPE